MTVEELEALFEKHDGEEFIKFERVTDRLSNRKDLHAFMRLDRLIDDSGDMIAGAEHDEIYLGIEPEDLAKVATEELVIELIRCGVRLGEYGLCMFA